MPTSKAYWQPGNFATEIDGNPERFNPGSIAQADQQGKSVSKPSFRVDLDYEDAIPTGLEKTGGNGQGSVGKDTGSFEQNFKKNPQDVKRGY